MKIIGFICAAIAFVFYRLFVCTKIWALIAIPYGLPAIGIMQAFGISLLVDVFNSNQHFKTDTSERTEGDAAKQLVSHTLYLSIIWLLAWLIFG